MSRATVLRAVAKGQLRPAFVTPGGHRRFHPGDIEGLTSEPDGRARRVELVGSRKAARLLGISQQTLNRAIREGRLRPTAVTPGGHRRFSAADIFDSFREVTHAGTVT